MNITEQPKGSRMARIYAHLIRVQPRKQSVQDILRFLEQTDSVSLRNVQRDLKDLAEISGACVGTEKKDGKLFYFIERDMRKDITLPIQRNDLLAFFLIKKLQPFFPDKSKLFDELSDAILDLSGETDYNLFEDIDENIAADTFQLGELSPLAIDNTLFGDLLTALLKKRKMNIVYQRSDLTGTVDKTICPVKLVVFKGELYFLCTTPQWDYYIKLSRILTAAITDETFTLPADRRRRIEERLSASFGIFDEVEPDIKKIVVKFPARPYYKLIFTERRFHDSQKITLDKNGNVMLTMRVPVGLDLINWVLSWPEAIVVEPPELMEKLLEIGMELIGKYEKNA